MSKPTPLFAGLNLHKDFITVAHAEAHRYGCTEPVRPPRKALKDGLPLHNGASIGG
jgi:hypothetical protein